MGQTGPSDPRASEIKARIDRFNRLFEYNGEFQVIDAESYRIQKKAENDSMVVYNSGLADLDYYTGGFAEEELIVVTGLFGNGKTLFIQTLLKQFGNQQIPCLLFSYEVSTLNFLAPYPSLFKIPFYVAKQNLPNKFTWLEERIIEAKVKYNIKMVFIDHLHFVVEMSSQKINVDISVVMRRLAMLAKAEKLVIFLVCHQKSIDINKMEPGLDTCRDSSAIPQECHTGIVVHRMKDKNMDKDELDSYDQGFAWVKIDKARRAGTYRKKLNFQKVGKWLEPIL